MTDGAPTEPLELARRALAAQPAGVLTDLDGTLSPIVDDPAAARVADRGDAALRALAGRLAVTGIITGRAPVDARRIAGVDELLVIGNHGLEWLEPGAAEPTAPPGLDWVAEAVERSLQRARDRAAIDGVTLDHKGRSGTIHYRMATEPATARRLLLAAVADDLDPRLEVREGRMSIELRPIGAGDKGTALEQVAERYGLRGLVVLGDDVTDLDMFHAARALRDRGALRAAILAVGGGGEVRPEVAAAADATLPDPAAAVALFEALLAEE